MTLKTFAAKEIGSAPTMNEVVKKKVDKTSSRRAASYLARLSEKKGRRVLVDLSEEHASMLDELITDGFGVTVAAVVREALVLAHTNRFKGQ